MQRHTYDITINAPRTTVWHTMLDPETYPQWASEFSPNSTYQGDWEQGSKIRFGDGSGYGLSSRIVENVPESRIEIEHLAALENGQEVPDSAASKAWNGAREIYEFTDTDGGTALHVETDISDRDAEMLDAAWPKALEKLKQLAEA